VIADRADESSAEPTLRPVFQRSPSRRIPTSTARRVRSCSQSISSSAKARLSDPVGSVEVGEHEDVEQLGAGSGAKRIETISDSALEIIRTHGRRLA
jgi:hypothetical protein